MLVCICYCLRRAVESPYAPFERLRQNRRAISRTTKQIYCEPGPADSVLLAEVIACERVSHYMICPNLLDAPTWRSPLSSEKFLPQSWPLLVFRRANRALNVLINLSFMVAKPRSAGRAIRNRSNPCAANRKLYRFRSQYKMVIVPRVHYCDTNRIVPRGQA